MTCSLHNEKDAAAAAVIVVVFSADALLWSNYDEGETMFNMLHDVNEEKLINCVCY
jgi:hypothetical protein